MGATVTSREAVGSVDAAGVKGGGNYVETVGGAGTRLVELASREDTHDDSAEGSTELGRAHTGGGVKLPLLVN